MEFTDGALLAQVLGFISLILGICTFYQKDDKRLKIFLVVFSLNHLVHFLLLGAIAAAAGAMISALRSLTAIYTSSRRVAALFIALSLVIGFFVVDTATDLLPLLGTIIGTYSVFVLRGTTMRVGFMLGAVCWLANNIIVGSIGGSVLEFTLLLVNLTTFLRIMSDRKITQIQAKEDLTTCSYITKTSN
jgi:hypothetical protein